MRTRIVAMCGAALLPWVCQGQVNDEGQGSEPSTTLTEVLVTGEFPGPGLWKVSKQTEEGAHVLWILGGPGPIPSTITWRSRQVENIIANSQEVIGNSSIGVGFGKKPSLFRNLTLVPSILKARKNPDGQRLQNIVPADVYERWLVQKATYLGRDSGIEKLRPVFAADELKEEAQKKTGGLLSNSVWSVIYRIAKEHKIKVISPGVWITIPSENMKPLLKTFIETPLPDTECFAATISMVEALGDTAAVRGQGMAWATGDLSALGKLPVFPESKAQCDAALMNSQILKDLRPEGSDEIAADLEQQWFAAVDKALATNRSTFAVVPISELLNPAGKLSVLSAKGYVIQAPSETN